MKSIVNPVFGIKLAMLKVLFCTPEGGYFLIDRIKPRCEISCYEVVSKSFKIDKKIQCMTRNYQMVSAQMVKW